MNRVSVRRRVTLDFVAWVNVAVIVLFFSLLGSRFVLAPGLLIDAGEGEKFELPKTPEPQYSRTASRLVVTYRRDDVILFEGAIVKLPELEQHLTAYAKKHPGEVLLLVADRHVTLEAVTKLSAMARSVGFAYVQTANERSGYRDRRPAEITFPMRIGGIEVKAARVDFGLLFAVAATVAGGFGPAPKFPWRSQSRFQPGRLCALPELK